jgi:hypothetical protein
MFRNYVRHQAMSWIVLALLGRTFNKELTIGEFDIRNVGFEQVRSNDFGLFLNLVDGPH